MNAEPRYGIVFWGALVAGWAVIAFGLLSLLGRAGATRPPNFAVFFLGAIVVHDLIVTPLVIAFGRLVGPAIPRAARGPVLGAVFVTAVVALASAPVVFAFGRLASNPSLLPRDGMFGLAVVLALVWAGTAVVVGRAVRAASRAGRTS